MPETVSFFQKHRYSFIIGTYLVVTGAAVLKVARQPYVRAVKAEEIETIFKGTTLAAIIASVGVSGKINKTRSSAE